MRSLAIALMLLAIGVTCANGFDTEYNKGKGIENLSFCIDPNRAKSDLLDKVGKGGDCKRALIRHGNKSENQLGASAIKEICLGHRQIAQELIIACNCHNRSGYQAVFDDWERVTAWALQHPICGEWADLRRQAEECRASGKDWFDGIRACKNKTDPPPPPPSFTVTALVHCISVTGNTARSNPSASGQSCDEAAANLRTKIESADMCQNQGGNLYKMDRERPWEYLNTGTCVMKP